MLFLCCLNRDNIGYPIAECAADGKFILSKPPNTGGLVSPSTVAEQVRVKQFKCNKISCPFTVLLQHLLSGHLLMVPAMCKQ